MATAYNNFVTLRLVISLRLLFRMGLSIFLTYVKVKEENGEGLLKSACIEMSAFQEISDQAPFSLFRFTTVPISILVF